MPEEQQNEEQQMGPVEADQASQDEQYSARLDELRNRDRLAENQADDGDFDGEGNEEDEGGEDNEVQATPPKHQPKPLYLYFILGFIAVLIDVVIPLIGGGIFTIPISFALGLIFKVLCYFFLPQSKDVTQRILRFWLPAGLDTIIDIIPGNIAIVLFAWFFDYKEKILKVASVVAKFAGPEAKAAMKAVEIADNTLNRIQGREQGESGQEDSVRRWKPMTQPLKLQEFERSQTLLRKYQKAQADNEEMNKGA